jgi:hypothetical protein
MRWFRVHASRIATVAMLSLAAVGVSAVGPHEDDCHDTACQAIVVAHDESAHAITAPDTADPDPPHCLVCHWARSFRPRTEHRVVTAPVSEPGITLHVEYVAPAARTAVAQPPLRSPPSSLAVA